MSSTSRLSKFQRLKYLNPERWMSGELCFWRGVPGFKESAYEEALSEWMKGQQRNIKADNR